MGTEVEKNGALVMAKKETDAEEIEEDETEIADKILLIASAQKQTAKVLLWESSCLLLGQG